VKQRSTVDHSVSIFTRKHSVATWIKGRADLLRRQTGKLGAPGVGKCISDANLV
jgi:hypothetical protein